MSYEIKKPLQTAHGPCLCCPNTESHLALDTVLYNAFGGYVVLKNGEEYFEEEMDKPWEENKTLADIEKEAAQDPNNDWQIRLDLPLRAGKWQRQGPEKWVLFETGEGFA